MIFRALWVAELFGGHAPGLAAAVEEPGQIRHRTRLHSGRLRDTISRPSPTGSLPAVACPHGFGVRRPHDVPRFRVSIQRSNSAAWNRTYFPSRTCGTASRRA